MDAKLREATCACGRNHRQYTSTTLPPTPRAIAHVHARHTHQARKSDALTRTSHNRPEYKTHRARAARRTQRGRQTVHEYYVVTDTASHRTRSMRDSHINFWLSRRTTATGARHASRANDATHAAGERPKNATERKTHINCRWWDRRQICNHPFYIRSCTDGLANGSVEVRDCAVR